MFYKFILALRSLLYYVLMFSSAFIFMSLMYLALLLPFRVRFKLSQIWTLVCIQLAKWICGVDYEVKGLENVTAGPYVFLCRHESAWETLALNTLLPPTVFVCKKSLLMVPFFGWAMLLTRQIPIDRSQGIKSFKKVIKQGKNRLEQGLSIGIFPEGTRIKPGEYPAFSKSGASLAKACGYPIIPIALNSGKVWPRNSFIKYPGKITVVIGKPIDSKMHSTDEINSLCYEWIKHNC
ncbi:MAG: lysophospholipid acyltransferase family protein [Gammaproteobacteria bacterium]|nr:lysophospholipid acyltransferase family protein [Gammaproteobacteria bacterium]